MKIFYLVTFIIYLSLISCKKYHEIENTSSRVEEKFYKADLSKKNNSEDPFLIWESNIENKNLSPSIFYAPHQDDETIGMGASISEQIRLGHPVFIVLLTNGANTEMLKYLKKIKPDATMKDLIDARNNEFIAACISLGASKIFISNYSEGFDESLSNEVLQEKFEKTMSYFATLYPTASHSTVSGNCDSFNNKCQKMPTHQAATNAIHKLYNQALIKEINLFRVYIYYNNSNDCDRKCSQIKKLNKFDIKKKQLAINQYKFVNYSQKRYGLAYNYSVQQLLDNSFNSNVEYIDNIQNDY